MPKKPDDDLCSKMRPDGNRIRPQRMGPAREPVFSLDANPGLEDGEPEAELTARFDWSNLCSRYDLTRLQERAVIHHIRRGIPRYLLHSELGCTRSEAITALNHGLAKLQRNPTGIGFVPVQNSRRLVYRENFGNGLRPWALNPLPPEFQAIMASERNYICLLPVQDMGARQKSGSILALISIRRKIVDLKTTLQNEQQRLERIGEALHRSRLNKDEADRALTNGLEELRKANAESILEGRSIDHAAFETKLTDLQRSARSGQAQFEAAQSAYQLQVETVDRLESEIAAQRNEAFAKEAAAVLTRVRTAVPTLANDMSTLHDLAAKHGIDAHGLTAALFPLDGRDSYRGGAIRVADAALVLNRFRWQWPKSKSA